MKLPSRLSIALGTLVTGLIALSLEVQMSHTLHVVCGLVGAFVLFMIHPDEGGVVESRPSTSAKPDGAMAAPPPGI